jgi:hypothetical protein
MTQRAKHSPKFHVDYTLLLIGHAFSGLFANAAASAMSCGG